MDILPVFDKNAAFIWACYIVGFATLFALGLYVLIKSRRAKAALERIERLNSQTNRTGE